jgi:hypothetical protein
MASTKPRRLAGISPEHSRLIKRIARKRPRLGPGVMIGILLTFGARDAPLLGIGF